VSVTSLGRVVLDLRAIWERRERSGGEAAEILLDSCVGLGLFSFVCRVFSSGLVSVGPVKPCGR
jgi:hypothetical protein